MMARKDGGVCSPLPVWSVYVTASYSFTYHRLMSRSNNPAGNHLGNIARRAMLERGLLPEFSAEVRKEAAAIETAATDSDPAIRDLRAACAGVTCRVALVASLGVVGAGVLRAHPGWSVRPAPA